MYCFISILYFILYKKRYNNKLTMPRRDTGNRRVNLKHVTQKGYNKRLQIWDIKKRKKKKNQKEIKKRKL